MPTITKQRRMHCVADEVVTYYFPDEIWTDALNECEISEEEFGARERFPDMCRLSPELGILALKVLNAEPGSDEQIDGENHLFETLADLGVFTKDSAESATSKADVRERLEWLDGRCMIALLHNVHSRLSPLPPRLREQVSKGMEADREWQEALNTVFSMLNGHKSAVRESFEIDIDDVIEEHEVSYSIE